ncbi:MAG: hypothetical protein GYA33_05695 [Thermogutta sp.]|nr:hypothetical protein [Thermogutta sp.]
MRAVHAAIGCLAVICFAAPSVRAEIILQYTFPTIGTGWVKTADWLAPDEIHPNLKDSVDMRIGDAGTAWLAVWNWYPSQDGTPYLNADPADGVGTADGAIFWDSAFSFSFEPEPGLAINLSSLEFDVARRYADRGWVLRSSLDNFSGTLAEQTGASAPTTWNHVSVDLSPETFQNIAGPVTFRFYVYASTGGYSTVDFDNITLNGTVVPVPEPAIWWLLPAGVVGVVAAAARGRRRSRGLTATS